MPHAKFDDKFPDHPKVASLSDSAYRLHTAGIIYCARNLTDGLVEVVEVPRLVRAYRKRALQELVDRGLWIALPGGAHYEIHDYLDHNDSKEIVEKNRARAAERQRKWREANANA